MHSSSILLTLSLCISIICGTNTTFGQQTPSQQYDALKASGQLNTMTPAQISAITSQIPATHEPSIVNLDKCSTPNNCELWIEPPAGARQILQGVDDGPAYRIDLPFSFCFYGRQYSTIHVTANGIVSLCTDFTQVPITFSSNPFPLASTDPIANNLGMIAPFWADVHLINNPTGFLTYDLHPTYIVITWKNVGYYANHTDKLNSFQVVLTNGTDPIIGVGNNVRFNYLNMDWTTGDASGGTNGFGGTPATAGLNRGDGTTYLQIGRFDNPTSNYDGPYGTVDGIDWLDYRSFTFNSCTDTSNNIAPIASRFSNCDTLNLCIGDTLRYNYAFLAPEPTQSTTIVVDSSGINANRFVISNLYSGVSAGVNGYIVANTLGFGTLTFTGTDNGLPAKSTVVNVVLRISEPPPAPIIVGQVAICPGQAAQLCTQIPYDCYKWTPNNQTTPCISVTQPGVYTVTTQSALCAQPKTSAPFTILLDNAIVPIITGNLHYCFNDSTVLTYSNPSVNVTRYYWSNLDTNQLTVKANAGVYVLTTESQYGCKGRDTVLVTNSSPDPAITGNKPFCYGDTIILHVQADFVNYVWTINTTDTLSKVDSTQAYQQGYHVIRVVDTYGCIGKDSIFIKPSVGPNVDFDMTPSFYIAVNAQVAVQSTATATEHPIDAYSWALNNAPIATGKSTDINLFTSAGEYAVTHIVIDTLGCPGSKTKNIIVIPEPPNIITPNEDGKNDKFVIDFINKIQGNNVQIFNRWGNKVLDQDNYQNDFTGKNLSDGVYFYVITFPDKTAYKGSLTIMKN